MSSAPAVLASAPFPFALRNFVSTGLVGELERRFGLRVQFVSPYEQASFADPAGETYRNWPVTASEGRGGLPSIAGVTVLDRALKSVHLTGFALEYPDGSLQNLELSRRRNAQRVIAGAPSRVSASGQRAPESAPATLRALPSAPSRDSRRFRRRASVVRAGVLAGALLARSLRARRGAATRRPQRLHRAELGQPVFPRAALPPARPSPGVERGDAAAGGRGAPVP